MARPRLDCALSTVVYPRLGQSWPGVGYGMFHSRRKVLWSSAHELTGYWRLYPRWPGSLYCLLFSPSYLDLTHGPRAQ